MDLAISLIKIIYSASSVIMAASHASASDLASASPVAVDTICRMDNVSLTAQNH